METPFTKQTLLFLSLLCITLSNCKPSKEEQLKTYLAGFRKIEARVKPFYAMLHDIEQTLTFPQSTELVFESKPKPAMTFEMKTSNVLWFDITEKIPSANYAPTFKLTEIIPASVATSAITILDDIREKIQTDSLSLAGRDTSGLNMFVSALDIKRTPYAVFLKELQLGDTDIEKKDFLDYTFEGGNMILAVWVVDLTHKKVLGSYVTEVRPEHAYHISSFGDTTSENSKMESMKINIYMEACQKAFSSIRDDIKSAQDK